MTINTKTNIMNPLENYIKFRRAFEELERDCRENPSPEKWEIIYALQKVGVKLEKKIDYDAYVASELERERAEGGESEEERVEREDYEDFVKVMSGDTRRSVKEIQALINSMKKYNKPSDTAQLDVLKWVLNQ